MTEEELTRIEGRCHALRDLSGYRCDIIEVLDDSDRLINEVRRLRENNRLQEYEEWCRRG